MPLAEDSGSRWQDAQIRKTKEETEKDTFEPAMKKQEGSSESSGLKHQNLHARNREEEREADMFELTKNSDSRYPMIQVRKSEDTKEADKPEPEIKKKKGIIGLLSVKEPTTKSVTNMQKRRFR